MAPGFLENLWNSDAGFLQKRRLFLFCFFFFTERKMEGWLEFRGLSPVPNAVLFR